MVPPVWIQLRRKTPVRIRTRSIPRRIVGGELAAQPDPAEDYPEEEAREIEKAPYPVLTD